MNSLESINEGIDESLRAHPRLEIFIDYLYEVAATAHKSLTIISGCSSGDRVKSEEGGLVSHVDGLSRVLFELGEAAKQTYLSEEEKKVLSATLGMITMSVMGMKYVPLNKGGTTR